MKEDKAKAKKTEEQKQEEQQATVEDKEQEIAQEEEGFSQKIEQLKKELEETKDKALRTFAEFDNFRKRSAKEKDAIYQDAVADTVKEFIPVLDNLERAFEAAKQSEEKSVCDGIELTLKAFLETLKKIGVEAIPAEGEEFNPELHSAVMHIEDEKIADNTIVEEFQKGYKLKDKVIRYSAVKVAN